MTAWSRFPWGQGIGYYCPAHADKVGPHRVRVIPPDGARCYICGEVARTELRYERRLGRFACGCDVRVDGTRWCNVHNPHLAAVLERYGYWQAACGCWRRGQETFIPCPSHEEQFLEQRGA